METFKSPVARLARRFQKSRDAWKTKALDKQRRLRAAQVKIRDLDASRASWKDRALAAEREGKPSNAYRYQPLSARKATRGRRPSVSSCRPRLIISIRSWSCNCSLRPLIGYRYPDKTAFFQALQGHSDLALEDLDNLLLEPRRHRTRALPRRLRLDERLPR